MAGPLVIRQSSAVVAEASRSWDDKEQVDWYLDRVRRLEPRQAGEQALTDVIPERPDALLDLGCGDGRLSSLVLSIRPTLSRVVCTDISPSMLELARQRFADDERVTVEALDMANTIAPLGAFDLVVSGFAIHHLEHQRKRALFAEIARQLRPGGVFANLEVVASATPQRHLEFLRAIGRVADDPEDRLATVEDQVAWMAASGLRNVDCLWRWRGFALLVGEAR